MSENNLPMSAKSWYALHPTGMQVLRPPDIEEYLEVGETLTNITYALQFWWGDYILHGESRADWGEMYTQALEESGRAYHTLTKAVSVCRKLPLEIRREDVPFSTHAVIAKISGGAEDVGGQARAKDWLDYTADHRMAGRDVGVLMSAYQNPPRDLEYTNELQRSALIVTGLINGELPPPQDVEVDDNLLNELMVTQDKLDVAMHLLFEVWKAWPHAVSDNVIMRIQNVIKIQSTGPRQSNGNGRDINLVGSAQGDVDPVVQAW